VTYYSTNYADPTLTGVVAALNQVMATTAARFTPGVADGFTAFATAAAADGGDACAAGLLIRLPTGGCDIHPSRRGSRHPGQDGDRDTGPGPRHLVGSPVASTTPTLPARRCQTRPAAAA
jgi:hypothetical protein